MPWHVLPRKASSTRLTARKVNGQDVMTLANTGAAASEFDFFSLLKKSPRLPNSERPNPGDNFALIDLHQFGVRHLPAAVFGADYLEFAITTFDRRSHPNHPAEFDIYIDTTGDGVPDFVLFNAEFGGFNTSGQNARLPRGPGGDAAGGGSSVLHGCGSQRAQRDFHRSVERRSGVTPGTTLGIDVYAFDNYFTGALTDAIEGMRFTPGSPRYSIGDLPFGEVAPGGSLDIPLTKAKVSRDLSSEIGALLLYRHDTPSEDQSIVRGQ